MKFVQLRSIKDLVLLVASSPAMNVIQHLHHGNSHLYFIVGGTISETFMYFVKDEKPLPGSFIVYSTYTSEISFSDKLKIEPNMSSFPIVDIVNQNILPPELMSALGEQ